MAWGRSSKLKIEEMIEGVSCKVSVRGDLFSTLVTRVLMRLGCLSHTNVMHNVLHISHFRRKVLFEYSESSSYGMSVSVFKNKTSFLHNYMYCAHIVKLLRWWSRMIIRL